MDDYDDDNEMESDALMKSMGFGAFGGTDNRPKRTTKEENKLPPKPPATGANAQVQGGQQAIQNRLAQVRERPSGGEQGGRGGRGGHGGRGGRGHGDNQPSKRQKMDNDEEAGPSRGKNKWAGWEQGGSGYSEWFYSPSFVEDPWASILGPESDFKAFDAPQPQPQPEPASQPSPPQSNPKT